MLSEGPPTAPVTVSPPSAAAPVAVTTMASAGGTSDSSLPQPLDAVASRVERLAELLDETNRLGHERERTIDRLHEENQRLRRGELERAIAPLLRDLVRLFDDLDRTMRSFAQRHGHDPAPVTELACFRDAVGDVLYRHGLESYDVAVGAPFDAGVHRALATVPTSDPASHRTIARVIRLGFRNESGVFRFLDADVFKHVPACDLEPST